MSWAATSSTTIWKCFKHGSAWKHNMPMRLRLTLIGVLAFTCTAASAQGSPAQKSEFPLTIRAPQTIKSGTTLNVEATLTNNSDHSIGLWVEAGAGIPYWADVRQVEDDKLAPQTRLGLIFSGKIDVSDLTPREFSKLTQHSGGQTVVKPGDSVHDEYNVSKFYDLSVPGKYVVQLSLLDAISRIKDESKVEEVRGKVWSEFEELIRGTVKSNVITVSVTP